MDTNSFIRNILVLEKAYELLLKSEQGGVEYEIYSSACVKQFELVIDISVSILHQYIKSSGRAVIMLVTVSAKDVYRSATGIGSPLPLTASKRWIKYQEIREKNNNKLGSGFHDVFMHEMLGLLPKFIKDAKP